VTIAVLADVFAFNTFDGTDDTKVGGPRRLAQAPAWRGDVVGRMTAVVLLVAGAVVQAQSPPVSDKDTRSLNLSAYAELLRSDVRAEKVAILTELMELNESEDKVFWPMYREYDSEMAKLGDERVALIGEYANNYAKLTDAVADQLAKKALDLESRRQAVKAKYFERIKAALSPKTALRFLQIEHQLNLIIDLQISAALPIVQ